MLGEVWKESCVSSKTLVSNMGRYRMVLSTGKNSFSITARATDGNAYATVKSGGKRNLQTHFLLVLDEDYKDSTFW